MQASVQSHAGARAQMQVSTSAAADSTGSRAWGTTFERESARLAAEAAAKQAADARAAKEKERLEAPRQYAASLHKAAR